VPKIRAACVRDVDAIVRLLDAPAKEGILLPRDAEDVLEHLQEFFVAEEDGKLLATGALHLYTPQLAEIRSLAVHPGARRRGLGKALVAALEAHAKKLGIDRLFVLTYEVGFFRRLGYREVAKESLPQKIWRVCVHCPRFPRCDETALLKDLACANPS